MKKEGEQKMSKVKKILAVVLSMAMIMGMSITSFAAPSTTSPYVSTITVNGLSEREATTVKAYAAVTLAADQNSWVVADWAKNYIKLSTDKKKYEITDAATLGTKVPASVTDSKATVETAEGSGSYKTTVEFTTLPVGAYVLIASGNLVSYTPMVANTYDDTNSVMASKDASLNAKASSYDLDKSADDDFVARGQSVNFTITTTFPNFKVADSKDNAFTVVDTPTGLDITGITEVTVGGTDVTDNVTAGYNTEKTAYTVN